MKYISCMSALKRICFRFFQKKKCKLLGFQETILIVQLQKKAHALHLNFICL